MKSKRFAQHTFSVVAFAMCISTSFAEEKKIELPTGTGADGATYSTMHKQWVEACPAFSMPEYKVTEPGTNKLRNNNGTVENLQGLLSNQIVMGYAQADAVWNLAQKDPNVQNLRVLAVLYPEAVHVLTTSSPAVIKVPGKVFGTNDVTKSLNTVADLSGLTVAAWGGSYVTAGIISQHIMGSTLKVVEVQNKEEAFTKLKSGEVQAIVAVGGYPVKWMEQLGSEYKLLPFPKAMRDKVGTSYSDAKLTYTRMGANGIESGETTSILLAQNFGPKKARVITEAFDCMVENLEDLRDTTGKHPAWKKVDPEKTTSILPKFPFVRTAGAPNAPSVAPAKKK